VDCTGWRRIAGWIETVSCKRKNLAAKGTFFQKPLRFFAAIDCWHFFAQRFIDLKL
jgi:hypothetical protein